MRDCARFLFNHNPFYPLSAALIMVGLREAMQSWGPTTGGAWWLAQWLAAYTVLLAVTAVVIIRAGKVWDDARTICLLVVLMFMAMSASFDSLCVETPQAARILLAAAWIFSIGITEWLTCSARFKFPILYRGPFYALLGLFFGFPAIVSAPWWDQMFSGIGTVFTNSAAWRVLSFSSLAGLLTLTLLPAIRRGATYVNDNGSPWNWPLYPWSVFVFIAIGVCGRSYLLTFSFQNDLGNQSSFGGYYLVPFALAILIVIAEVAMVHKFETLKQWMLVAPWVLIALATIPGTSNAYYLFLNDVMRNIGSPLWLSLMMAFVFLAYLGSRGIANYRAAMVPVLFALVGIGPQTRTVVEYEPQQAWPLVLFAAYHVVMLVRKPTGVRFSFAWIMAVVGASIHWHDTAFTRNSYLLPWHMALVGVWLTALLFSDAWALYWRRRLPAAWLILAAIASLILVGQRDVQWKWWLASYSLCLCGFAMLSWWILHMKLWKWSMASIALMLLMCGLMSASRSWQTNLPTRAFQSLALGAASFVIGGTISAAKAGLTRGAQGSFKREWQAICAEWQPRLAPPSH